MMSSSFSIRRIDSAEWKEYREVRLRALKDSPDAFGSTFEESIMYPDDAWIARLESVIGWARGRGVTRLLLDVTCGDRPARRLYDTAGFKAIGEPQPLREGSSILEQPMELKL